MHVDTKTVVRIVKDEGNFLTLNDGTKIDKQLFAQKYAAIGGNDQINAKDFLSQKTNIQVNPPKTTTQINENNSDEAIITPSGSIDPDEFLYSLSLRVDGLDNIKKIDTSKHIDMPEESRVTVRDLSQEQSAIAPVHGNQSFEEQKRALLEKHQQTMAQNQAPGYVDENDPQAVDALIKGYQQPVKQTVLNENGLTEHQERMRQQYMELKNGEDPYAEKIRKYRISKGLPPEPIKNPATPVQTQQPAQTQQVQQPVQEDPTTALFKKFKRNSSITINLKIKDKISKPDFIKVMADGLEGDIIQYYTDEIMKAFMQDYEGTKQEIYNQIHLKVYDCLPGEDIDDEEDKPKGRTIPNVPKEERSQLNEGVPGKEDVLVLIPGKPTKTGKTTFKYLNDKGKVVDMIPQNAEKKGYKPATKKDLA